MWDIDCVLELRVGEDGRLCGVLDADGEALDVAGGAPGADGLVRGVIRARDLDEPFAVFVAWRGADELFLEVDVTHASGNRLETVERALFVRLA